jgi:hypothetical protein
MYYINESDEYGTVEYLETENVEVKRINDELEFKVKPTASKEFKKMYKQLNKKVKKPLFNRIFNAVKR